ncbi:MAG: AMP-binding protein, partial [Pseudomonas sp.]|nr:AMP-binding protein [Pseudomonas sp.]
MTNATLYSTGLDQCQANFTALSPLSFLARAAHVYPERTAVIYGAIEYSWASTYERCRRLASALSQHGVQRGDTVAVLLPNVPAMYEA